MSVTLGDAQISFDLFRTAPMLHMLVTLEVAKVFGVSYNVKSPEPETAYWCRPSCDSCARIARGIRSDDTINTHKQLGARHDCIVGTPVNN